MSNIGPQFEMAVVCISLHHHLRSCTFLISGYLLPQNPNRLSLNIKKYVEL